MVLARELQARGHSLSFLGDRETWERARGDDPAWQTASYYDVSDPAEEHDVSRWFLGASTLPSALGPLQAQWEWLQHSLASQVHSAL